MATAFGRFPHEVLAMKAADYLFAVACIEAARDHKYYQERDARHAVARRGGQ